MTTTAPDLSVLAPANFLEEMTGKHIAHLSSLRSAWRAAILAYGTMGETNGESLREAVRDLIAITGDPQAGMQAAQAYTALQPYPMPDLTKHGEDVDDAMWDLFFMLVLAVQSDILLRMAYHSEQLETLAAGTGLGAKWWLDRARAYAPLGLTIATRV